jgi:cell division protein FtsL
MQMKVTLFILCAILTIFLHFMNEHSIVQSTREYTRLEKLLNAERTINTELWIENNELTSRDRIAQIATSQMGMVCPKTDGNAVVYIKESESKDKVLFSLIDFISPEAQALTQK